jgi:hypothetical protein
MAVVIVGLIGPALGAAVSWRMPTTPGVATDAVQEHAVSVVRARGCR